MPSAVAWPAGLVTLIRNWTQTSVDTTPHSRHQTQRIAASIRLGRGCAFESVKCVRSYRNADDLIGAVAHLVTQITLFATTISLLAHHFAFSEQSLGVPHGPSGTAVGGRA